MKSGLVLKGLVVGVLIAGSATAADAPRIAVTNVDTIVTADFLGNITLPKRVPHSFEQKGAEPFVILVNATPGWDPLKDTRYLE